MNLQWQQFLERCGARVAGGRVGSFGDPAGELAATRTQAILSVLSHLALLRFTGEDAQAFLHGQLSCDVNGTGPDRGTFGSYCSPKGRMLANFLLWRVEGGWLMALSSSLAAAIQKRLSRFVLRSKVHIAMEDDRCVLLGVAGEGAARVIGRIFPDVPPAELDVRSATGAGTVIRLHGNRYLIAASAPEAARLWTDMSRDLKPVGAPCWEWLDIRYGIPWVSAATQELFVPQMANLELLGGVSFSKGCYPGQEVVARTHHLGEIKRRMLLANVPERAAEGDALYSEELGDQASGTVVNVQASPEGGYDVLAVVQVARRANGAVRLKSIDGPALKFLPMPYPVP